MALLHVSNVSYRYHSDVSGKEVQALSDISFELPKGLILTIIGPSRSGKSTFLRLLNRLQEVSSDGVMTGKILLDGQDIYSANYFYLLLLTA